MARNIGWVHDPAYRALLGALKSSAGIPQSLKDLWAAQRPPPRPVWRRAGRAASSHDAPPSLFALRPPCRSLGLVEPGQTCGCLEKLRRCDTHGGHCTVAVKRADARCCLTCPDHAAPDPVPAAAGVAVGSYGWPRLCELQVKLLRHHNPGVPVLIVDDASPAAQEIEQLEGLYDDVTVWVNPSRYGHYAGDLRVFWAAVQWGHVREFRTVAKLSQRMLVDRPGWLSECAALLRANDPPVGLAGQRCIDNGVDLCLRTEFAVMDVAKWLPALAELDPEGRQLGQPTEYAVNGINHRRFGDKIAPIPWLPVNRNAKAEGTCWHTTDPVSEYAKLAARFGLAVDADLSCLGRNSLPNWVKG